MEFPNYTNSYVDSGFVKRIRDNAIDQSRFQAILLQAGRNPRLLRLLSSNPKLVEKLYNNPGFLEAIENDPNFVEQLL